MIDFLIIGSGFAGAAMSIHLGEAGVDPKNINVVGPTILGSGNAFGCKHKDYRLNVRSEIMWIYPEKKMNSLIGQRKILKIHRILKPPT